MTSVVHVVGAELSGLSAAVRLVEAGRTVLVHEAASHTGGRCRSYHDPQLGMSIDNGNHLVLSGNGATFAFLNLVGGREAVAVHAHAEFSFIDLPSGERWTLRINEGRVPWWILDPDRRVPGTQATDYASILRLLAARPGTTVSDVLSCEGPLYERLWRPVLLAALNIDPKEADATLAAQVLRETFGKGGQACRPVLARDGLSDAFVDPALRFLEKRGAVIRHGSRLRRLAYEGGARRWPRPQRRFDPFDARGRPHPRASAESGGGRRPGSGRTDGSPGDREHPLPRGLPGRDAAADRRGERIGRLDTRPSGQDLRDGQRGGPRRDEPSRACASDLDRGLLRHRPVHDGPLGRASALAGHPRETGDLRRDACGRSASLADAHGIPESLHRRRLDRHGSACLHRRGDPVRREGRASRDGDEHPPRFRLHRLVLRRCQRLRPPRKTSSTGTAMVAVDTGAAGTAMVTDAGATAAVITLDRASAVGTSATVGDAVTAMGTIAAMAAAAFTRT